MKKMNLTLMLVLIISGTVFPQTPKQKIKVYLLGTFHFSQTDSTYDVLTEKNQNSIIQICKIIARQKPDKVFIERMPEFEHKNKMDSLYQAYRKGDTGKRRNEIWQIAFRVANDLNHKTIYACDHPGRYGYYYNQLEKYAATNGQTDILRSKGKGITIPLTSLVNNDSLMHHSDLLDYMRWLNSKKVQETSHASYINRFPQLGNTNVFRYDPAYLLGTELTSDWYRRNIMIYAKMINQLDYNEKAIFLVMGNDHIPIIKHLFQSNPYFKVVETEKWLGKTKIK
jgi:hypothetical protein